MKIRVKFTDQPLGFDPQDNCYIRALRRRYDVELSDEPDLVFYSVFGTDFLNYPGSVRIFLANEPVLYILDVGPPLHGRPPDDAVHVIAFFQQGPGQEAAVLPCDSGDQRCFHCRSSSLSVFM